MNKQTPNLGCTVTDVMYDLVRNTGHVYMPANNCVDMKSTIDFFTGKVPTISHIMTWCDGNLDTQYVIHGDEWIAI